MWKLLAPLAFLAILVFVFASQLYFSRRALRRIVKEGRSISWDDALKRVGADHGYLIINYSSVPGKLWWLQDLEQDEGEDLYFVVEERGLLVTGLPKKSIADLVNVDNVRDRVKILDYEVLMD